MSFLLTLKSASLLTLDELQRECSKTGLELFEIALDTASDASDLDVLFEKRKRDYQGAKKALYQN